MPDNVSSTCGPVCAWDKASDEHLYHYRHTLDRALSSIDLTGLLSCTNLNCHCIQHKQLIDMVCSSLIDCCIKVGVNTLPLVKHSARNLPGWNDHVKHEREQPLF